MGNMAPAMGTMPAQRQALPFTVMVVLGTTIHEFADSRTFLPNETRGWSDQVRP